MNIAIIGIGGVGGYLGAKLAYAYPASSDIKIAFIARGAHLETIRAGGLKLITPLETIISYPHTATDNTAECEKMDYIFYCTKSYDIALGAESLKPMLKPETVIIPYMNGVDGVEYLRKTFPSHTVCSACAFIVSSIAEYGTIEEKTEKNHYLFGDGLSDTQSLLRIEKTVRDAGINMSYKQDIERRVWEKFEYISPLATITTAYNITCGELLRSDVYRTEVMALLNEFENVAMAKGELHESISYKTFEKFKLMPENATSSMSRDYYSGHTTEVESLTGYIIKEGVELLIPTPTYNVMYKKILNIRP